MNVINRGDKREQNRDREEERCSKEHEVFYSGVQQSKSMGGGSRCKRSSLFSEVSVHLGVELAILDGVEELFGDRELELRLFFRRAGNGDVEFVGLGSENLGIETILGQVDDTTRSLVDGDGGNLDDDLDLHAVAVNDLAGGDGFIEHDVGLLAAVDGEGVELTLDLDGGASALVDVDSLFLLGDLDRHGAGLVLHNPLVALQFELGGLVGDSRGTGTKFAGRLGSRFTLLDLSRAVSTVLGLHVSGDLLETRGDALSLVKSSKDARHIRGIRGAGASTRGGSRRRGTRRRRTSSGGSRRSGGRRGSGGRGRGRGGSSESIATLGVPGQTSGVVLLDVGLERLQETIEVVDPLNLLLVLALLVTTDLVGVELRGTNNLLDVRDRSRGLKSQRGSPMNDGAINERMHRMSSKPVIAVAS